MRSTWMDGSIETGVSPIWRNTNIAGSEKRGKRSVGGIVLIARLESSARSHEALKAGSTERGNQVPLALQFGATFRQEHPLPPTPFAAKDSLVVAAVRGGAQHGRARGLVPSARDRHASSHKPRAQRRCDRRGCSHVRERDTHKEIYICIYMQTTNGRRTRTRKQKKTQKLKPKTQMEKSDFDWINGDEKKAVGDC